MKKQSVILILLVCCFFSSCNYSYSENVKDNNYEIVQNETIDEINDTQADKIDSVYETDKITILKIGKKFAIYDKETDSMVFEPIIDEISAFNENEYKVKVGNLVGYVNIENKNNFLTNYDDIILFGNYIKTIKENKYGLIDNKSNIILKPIYDKVGIFYNDGKEYISAKYDGKYKLYQNTGKIIPEKDLYVVLNDQASLLAMNLKPELKKYKYDNAQIFQDTDTKYEIEEINIPEIRKTESTNEDITSEDNEPDIESNNQFTIDNKTFILVKKDNKFGINTLKGEEILPPIYDNIVIVNLTKDYNTNTFWAIKNNVFSEYSLNGEILAEQVYDKINIYRYGNVYSYNKNNNIWDLRCNGKLIGQLTIENDDYKYSKSKFHLNRVNKINEIFISILENAKE